MKSAPSLGFLAPIDRKRNLEKILLQTGVEQKIHIPLGNKGFANIHNDSFAIAM